MNLESSSIADINSIVESFSSEDSISDLEPTNNINETQLTNSQWDDLASHIQAEELNLDNYAIETISNPQIPGDASTYLQNIAGETGTADSVLDNLSGADRVVVGDDDTLLSNEEAEQAKEAASLSFQVAVGNEEQREQFTVALTGKEADDLTNMDKQNLDLLFDNLVQGKEPAVDFVVASQAPLQDIVAENPELDDNTLPLSVNGAFVKNDSGSGGKALLSGNLEDRDVLDVAKEEYGEAIAAEAAALGIDLAPGDVGARLLAVLEGNSVDPATNPDAFIDAPEDSAFVLADGDLVEAQAVQIVSLKFQSRSDGSPPSNDAIARDYLNLIDAIRQRVTARELFAGTREDRVAITPNFNGQFDDDILRIDLFLPNSERNPSIQIWIEPSNMYVVGLGYADVNLPTQRYQYRPIGDVEGQVFVPTLQQAGYDADAAVEINRLPGLPENYANIAGDTIDRQLLNFTPDFFVGQQAEFNLRNLVDNGLNNNTTRRDLLLIATIFAEGARFNTIAETVADGIRNGNGLLGQRNLRLTNNWANLGEFTLEIQRDPTIPPLDIGPAVINQNERFIDNLREARELISLIPGRTADSFPGSSSGGPSSGGPS